jgi:hypothetical protein
VVSHETIRQWYCKFGQTYANELRRRRPRPGDKWHLDEVFIKIKGKTHYLWRAVDKDGNVLDILVTSPRDTTAATTFFRKLLTRWQYVPRVLVTDKLASYPCGATPDSAVGATPPITVSQQPGGELTSTDPGAGTSDERVHLSRACTTVSVRVQWDTAALSTEPSPAARRRIPPRNDWPVHHLELGHGHCHRRLTDRTGDPARGPIQPCPCAPDSPAS